MQAGLTGGLKARLTRRELEVANLVAQGLTNREIAMRLFISERTADGHLEHIRDKLGVGTRAEITAWLVRQEAPGGEPAAVELPAEPKRDSRRLTRHRLWLATAATIIAAVSAGFVARAAVGLFARPSGPTISTIAGTEAVAHGIAGGYSGDRGLATAAQLSLPRDVAVGPEGTVYIADSGNRVVRRIGKDGSITTVAGGGRAPLADGASATSVSLGFPTNLAVDSGGRLYVSTNVDGDLQVWLVRPDSTMARVVSGLSKGRSDAEQASGCCDPQPDSLRPTGRNNYFRIAAADVFQGAAMAGFAVRSLNVKRVAAFTEHPRTMGPIVDSFAAVLTRVGGEMVLRKDLEPGTTDFIAFLSTAKARGAQAIYVVGLSAERICGARATMKGVFPDDAYFLGFDSMVDNQCIKDAAENANNRIYATVSAVDPTQNRDPAVKQVVDAYRKAYPKPVDLAPYTFAGYDCARILIDAIKRAIDANGGRIPTRGQVVEAVAHTPQFRGVTGTYSFDAFGDATSPLMSVYRVDNGRWVFWQNIDARPG